VAAYLNLSASRLQCMPQAYQAGNQGWHLQRVCVSVCRAARAPCCGRSRNGIPKGVGCSVLSLCQRLAVCVVAVALWAQCCRGIVGTCFSLHAAGVSLARLLAACNSCPVKAVARMSVCLHAWCRARRCTVDESLQSPSTPRSNYLTLPITG
jgi:hypothetical protein